MEKFLNKIFDCFKKELLYDEFSVDLFIALCTNIWYDCENGSYISISKFISPGKYFLRPNANLRNTSGIEYENYISRELNFYREKYLLVKSVDFRLLGFKKLNEFKKSSGWEIPTPLKNLKNYIIVPFTEGNLKYILSLNRDRKINQILQ